LKFRCIFLGWPFVFVRGRDLEVQLKDFRHDRMTGKRGKGGVKVGKESTIKKTECTGSHSNKSPG